MNVCTQCGKENIPVIAPPDKCPHEYEIELKAADALAKALPVAFTRRNPCVCMDRHCGWCKLEDAVANYEKVRNGK